MNRAYAFLCGVLILVGLGAMFGAWNIGILSSDPVMVATGVSARQNFMLTGATFFIAGWAGLGLQLMRAALCER